MDRLATGFPRELLTQPWTARLEYFKDYTMAHPRLVQARDALLSVIQGVAPNSLILVLGPTGVGKTTLPTLRPSREGLMVVPFQAFKCM
jgi:flagellar biosynthesis GTPase FlhF